MDDDRKKPAGSGGRGRGPRKPADAKGGGKPFRRQDGAKRAFAKRDGEPAGGERPFTRKPRREDAAQGDETRPKRAYAPREDGEKKPFRRQDGAKRAFAKRDGEPAGGERPFTRKPRREDAAPGDETRPKRAYAPREDGEKKPFRRQDGAKRAFAGRDGGPPGKPRPGKRERREEAAGEGERRPTRHAPRPPREGEEKKPFRRQDGARHAFADRDSGAPGRPRPDKREREEQREPAEATGTTAGERIARRLARAGVSSRRDAEELIAAGRVTLNGKVLDTPAINVSDRDRIELDGKPIPAVERTRLFLFHKPAGVVTTSRDPEGRRTVFDILPAGLPRLMTIGRLDINTEGLLLLTNDGGLARVLELPATGWMRRYRVRVHGKVDPAALEALKEGVAVDGIFYGAIEASLDREQGSNAWLSIGLREGKNREVKNVLGALGLDVTRLIRVSFGPFQLGELAEGEVRELRGRILRDQLGERLIAEAGANFDAPVLNEFSNKPVPARQDKPRDEREERPNRKREREQKREDALGRLDTRKPPRGGGNKPSTREEKEKPARAQKPAGETRSRTSNVWMAPGAKPMGDKKKAALAERNEGRRYAGKPRPAGGKGGKPGGRPPKPGPRGPRGGG